MSADTMNAALDRQHPRDLFDVKVLCERELPAELAHPLT